MIVVIVTEKHLTKYDYIVYNVNNVLTASGNAATDFVFSEIHVLKNKKEKVVSYVLSEMWQRSEAR